MRFAACGIVRRKSNLRSQVRKVRAAITAKKLDESVAAFKTLVAKLDRAARSQCDPRECGCPHEVAAVGCDQGAQGQVAFSGTRLNQAAQ